MKEGREREGQREREGMKEGIKSVRVRLETHLRH